MRSMAACLKLGGKLICEEHELATICPEPASKPYEEAVRRILQLADCRDLDYRIGSKIALHPRSIGVEELALTQHRRSPRNTAVERVATTTRPE